MPRSRETNSTEENVKMPDANRMCTFEDMPCALTQALSNKAQRFSLHLRNVCVSVCKGKILDVRLFICLLLRHKMRDLCACCVLLREDCLFIVIFQVRRGSHYDFLKKVIIFTACTRLTKMNSSIMIASQNRFSEISTYMRFAFVSVFSLWTFFMHCLRGKN